MVEIERFVKIVMRAFKSGDISEDDAFNYVYSRINSERGDFFRYGIVVGMLIMSIIHWLWL